LAKAGLLWVLLLESIVPEPVGSLMSNPAGGRVIGRGIMSHVENIYRVANHLLHLFLCRDTTSICDPIHALEISEDGRNVNQAPATQSSSEFSAGLC
jgi:hypothetical protein